MAAEAVGVVGGESSEPRGPRERLPLGLRNKQPHWNHNLRCHCLNFHGRVKEASVKNYQLVRPTPKSWFLPLLSGVYDSRFGFDRS